MSLVILTAVRVALSLKKTFSVSETVLAMAAALWALAIASATSASVLAVMSAPASSAATSGFALVSARTAANSSLSFACSTVA